MHPSGQSLTKPRGSKMTVENEVRTFPVRWARTSYGARMNSRKQMGPP